MIPIVCVLLLLPACGQAIAPEETTAVSESAETLTQAEAAEPETTGPIIQKLPGMIMADVHVRLWDGDVSPGLRDEDAQTIKNILARQTWGYSYDNLSDTWIEAQGVTYAYDTQSGILTAADDRAAKLTETERAQVNAILADYLPGYDKENGFYEIR